MTAPTAPPAPPNTNRTNLTATSVAPNPAPTPVTAQVAVAAVVADVQSDVQAAELLAANARTEYDNLSQDAQRRIHQLINDLEVAEATALPFIHTLFGAKVK
jgi:hypothetical protein